jgi:hypothetical protein
METIINDINIEDYVFDSGNQCSDEQFKAFVLRLNIAEKDINKFLAGFLLFYAINGATNAKSTLGFAVKYTLKNVTKYTMQTLTESATFVGTTIRQICRKFSDITVQLIAKTGTETRMFKKYNEQLKLQREYSFDFANFTKTISKEQNESLYMIKINKLIRRKIINDYTQCPYLIKKDDEIIRDDILGKELYLKAWNIFELNKLK